MAVSKLSQIANAPSNLTSGDSLVGVRGGTTDLLFSSTQIATTIGSSPLSGGTNTCILFDKAGVVGEDTNFEWDYTNHILNLGPNARLNSIGTTWRFDVGGTDVLDYGITLSGQLAVPRLGSFAANYFGTNTATSGDFPGYYLGLNGDGGSTWRGAFALGRLNNTFLVMGPGGGLSWDIELNRDASGIFGITNGSNHGFPAGLRVYNTNDSTNAGQPPITNYERAIFDWTTTSNVLTIGTQKGGTGSTRNIQIVSGNTVVLDWGITAAGNWTSGGLTGTNSFTAAYFGAVTTTTNVPGLYVKLNTDNVASTRVSMQLDNRDRGLLTFGAGGVSATQPDTNVERYGSSVLGISGGNPFSGPSTAAGFQVYNTVDTPGNPTNYERGVFDWTTTSNVLTIGTQAGGSGNYRPIQFVSGANGATAVGSYTFKTAADNNIFIGQDSGASHYNILSFNGSTTDAAGVNLGIVAGGTGVPDNNMYFEVPSGGGLLLSVGTSTVFQTLLNLTEIQSGGVFAFSSTTSAAGSADTGISRVAPVSSVSTIAIGNGTAGDASATIKAKTKAGAPTATDVPAGTWVLIRDTTNLTTKLYYNNAGTLQTVALV